MRLKQIYQGYLEGNSLNCHFLNQRCYFKIIIFLVTTQNYDVHTFLVTVIRGNDALFKCTVPSFVSDFLAITGWWDSEGNQLGVRNGNFGWGTLVNKGIRLS